MSEKFHLTVGVPSLSGVMKTELRRFVSALEVCAATGKAPFTLNVAEVDGLTPISYVRNVIARLALSMPPKTDRDRVIMFDDDMMPEPTVMRVIMSEADICVPRMYRFRHHGKDGIGEDAGKPPEIASCATFVDGDGPGEKRVDIVPEWETDGAVRVDGAGTGCIMIKRRLLEDPRLRVGQNDKDGTPAIFRFIQSDTGRILEWEDIDFTLRASRLGYSVVADFGARCGHMKRINLDAVAELLHRARTGEGMADEVLVHEEG